MSLLTFAQWYVLEGGLGGWVGRMCVPPPLPSYLPVVGAVDGSRGWRTGFSTTPPLLPSAGGGELLAVVVVAGSMVCGLLGVGVVVGGMGWKNEGVKHGPSKRFGPVQCHATHSSNSTAQGRNEHQRAHTMHEDGSAWLAWEGGECQMCFWGGGGG